jgi:hypothetical protein
LGRSRKGGGYRIIYKYAGNDPLNLIDANGEFPKNIDEAGQCIHGNLKDRVEAYKRNVQRNEKLIKDLTDQLSKTCSDEDAIQGQINILRKTNEGFRKIINEIEEMCSGFYFG